MKTIIFDLNGTLADVEPIERFTLMQVPADASTEDGLAAYQEAQRLLIAEGRMPTPPTFLERRMLEGLAGFSFALVTASPRTEVEFVLAQTGCLDLFEKDLVLCKGEYPGSKRTGEPFVALKTRIGTNAIVIGDTSADEEGAVAAGFPCVKVERRDSLEEQKKELEARIREAVQLLNP